MAKRTPLACTPENCGEAFPKCGKASTYSHRKCRCDLCYEAHAEKGRRYQEANREKVAAQRKQRYLENQEAILAQKKQYYRKNRAEKLEWQKQYTAANREAKLAYNRRYAEKNSATAVETVRQWRLENPDRRRAQSRRNTQLRRARMAATAVVEFTPEQLEQKMAYYGERCWIELPGVCTGEFDHVDHVKPIAKGGPHMIANFRPACAPCNLRKRDQWPFAA